MQARAFTAGVVGVILSTASFCLPGKSAQAEPDKRVLADHLTVCLPRNAGVIGGRRLTGGAGFDFLISEQLADQMGQPLNIVWYENELEEESDPVKETYAMLAYGLCDAVPGHPRYAPAVGTQDFERAVLPRWLGMQQEIDPDTGLFQDRLAGFVDVAPVAVSAGYMRSEIGLVYREGLQAPQDLGDLDGHSLHVQQGTLAGVIAMVQTTPEDRARITTHNPGAGFLWDVESGQGALALVDVAAFDSHLQANPFTPLRLAPWRHPIGMDIGIAVLAENEALMTDLNTALAALPEQLVQELAAEAGLSYAPPLSQTVMPALTMQMLHSKK